MGKKMTEEEMQVDENNAQLDQSGPLKYEDKVKFVSSIAQPLASKKLFKKLTKLIKKAKTEDTEKKLLRYGLKEVQSRIRKGETGMVVFAGDVTPIDVMCHMPAVCEEKNIPYIYIASRKDLAKAVGFVNSCLMVLIRDTIEQNESCKELYEECYTEVKKLGQLVC